MLNDENAKILETRVLKRLDDLMPDDNLHKTISKVATQTTIITLQEYERMSQEEET